MVITCCYPTHTGNEVSLCGWCGRTALKCLFWLEEAVLIGIDCGLLVASQHLRMVVLEAPGGAVLGVAWPLPSGPLRILNEHFRL